MRSEWWVALFSQHRQAMTLVALVTTFAGVALLVDRPKGTVLEWLAAPLLVLGVGLFVWNVWPEHASPTGPGSSIASRFLWRITLGGRLVRLFPVLGIATILGDLIYNLTLSASPALQTEDVIVLLAAASILGYGFVPRRFSRERDFVLMFFLWLNLILVVPLLITRVYYADFERSVDVYSWIALAPETSGILNIVGVANQVHSVAGSTAPGLTFTPQHFSVQVTIVITTACSGIYSFGIFASAFAAFVLTEYQRTSSKMWILLGTGFLTAYVANVLRMVVIVLVGYYTDTAQTDLQNMLIAHSYAGWLIFLGWIALFWWGTFRLLPRGSAIEKPTEDQQTNIQRRSTCGICGNSLTPVIPARKCTCNMYYHASCAREAEGCPSCGRHWLAPATASAQNPGPGD